VGLPVREARARLRAQGLVPMVERFADGRAGAILAQLPVGGVAAAPGMKVRLVVGHG
jgi:beta-lactam-binding protein with PASTA domain